MRIVGNIALCTRAALWKMLTSLAVKRQRVGKEHLWLLKGKTSHRDSSPMVMSMYLYMFIYVLHMYVHVVTTLLRYRQSSLSVRVPKSCSLSSYLVNAKCCWHCSNKVPAPDDRRSSHRLRVRLEQHVQQFTDAGRDVRQHRRTVRHSGGPPH